MDTVLIRVVFIGVFAAFLVMNALQEKGFKARGIETDGEKPVPKPLFAAGKVSTLLCWLAAVLQAGGLNLRMAAVPLSAEVCAAGLFLGGFAVLAAAYRGLGDANATGLPAGATQLKTGGIYAVTRNPLYLGLYTMCAGSALYCGNALVLVLAGVAVLAHHLTVLAEEKFLEARFGAAYLSYKSRTRRY